MHERARRRHGLSVTFMAKFASDQAGRDATSTSVCGGRAKRIRGRQSLGPIQCSDEFRWFLGGWIAHVPDVMVFYAPTVNSYKRYVDASWAPTRLAWSRDNRTAGFRIVGTGESLRIECRLPGADCNPYLGVRGVAGVGTGWHRQSHRAAGTLQWRHLCRAGTATRAVHAWRKQRSALVRAISRSARSVETSSSITSISSVEQNAYDMAVTDWERLLRADLDSLCHHGAAGIFETRGAHSAKRHRP